LRTGSSFPYRITLEDHFLHNRGIFLCSASGPDDLAAAREAEIRSKVFLNLIPLVRIFLSRVEEPLVVKANSSGRGESGMDVCMFCERLRNPSELADCLVYEDELFHVSHQLNEEGQTYLGSVIIQSRRHVHDLAELTEKEASWLGSLITRSSRALKNCTGAGWTYAESFLERYQHVHVIVTARYPSMPKEYIRLAIRKWPGAPRGTRPDVIELSRKLRAGMSSGK